MNYRENVQAMQEDIDRLNKNAEVLRDLTPVDLKLHLNDLRMHLSQAHQDLGRLDNKLAESIAFMPVSYVKTAVGCTCHLKGRGVDVCPVHD